LKSKESELKKQSNIIKLHYNREKFPAFIVKSKFGTILLYPKKYILVGGKCRKDLHFLVSLLQSILK